jgi:hypothetical protein
MSLAHRGERHRVWTMLLILVPERTHKTITTWQPLAILQLHLQVEQRRSAIVLQSVARTNKAISLSTHSTLTCEGQDISRSPGLFGFLPPMIVNHRIHLSMTKRNSPHVPTEARWINVITCPAWALRRKSLPRPSLPWWENLPRTPDQ